MFRIPGPSMCDLCSEALVAPQACACACDTQSTMFTQYYNRGFMVGIAAGLTISMWWSQRSASSLTCIIATVLIFISMNRASIYERVKVEVDATKGH